MSFPARSVPALGLRPCSPSDPTRWRGGDEFLDECDSASCQVHRAAAQSNDSERDGRNIPRRGKYLSHELLAKFLGLAAWRVLNSAGEHLLALCRRVDAGSRAVMASLCGWSMLGVWPPVPPGRATHGAPPGPRLASPLPPLWPPRVAGGTVPVLRGVLLWPTTRLDTESAKRSHPESEKEHAPPIGPSRDQTTR